MEPDLLDDLARKIIANPADVEAVKGKTLASGLTVITSDLVEAGKYLILDPAKIKLPELSYEAIVGKGSEPYAMEFDDMAWKVRYEFGLGAATANRHAVLGPSLDWHSPDWGRARDLRKRFGESVSWTVSAAL